MKFIVAAGTASEARAWAGRNKVRPCDMLVVLATFGQPATRLAGMAKADRPGALALSLYGVPVVRLVGWHLRAPQMSRLDLEQFLADLRPPMVQAV